MDCVYVEQTTCNYKQPLQWNGFRSLLIGRVAAIGSVYRWVMMLVREISLSLLMPFFFVVVGCCCIINTRSPNTDYQTG